MTVDFLIRGAGLAGTLLAWELLERGVSVLLVDRVETFSATNVSSGVLLPITGIRIVKCWRVSEFLPFAIQRYSDFNSLLHREVFKEKEVLRYIRNTFEHELAEKRLRERGYADVMQFMEPPEIPGLIPPRSFLRMRGGRVDTYNLTNLLKQKLKEREGFRLIQDEDVASLNVKAKTKIDCTGWHFLHRFPELAHAVSFAKGEIVTLRLPHFHCTSILNVSKSIVPIEGDVYSVGSTYEWNVLDSNPTPQGLRELLDWIATMVVSPVVVINHRAGIRPATQDRKPILGWARDGTFLFNGLGAKGCLFAPWFANHVANVLTTGEEVDAESNLSRFF